MHINFLGFFHNNLSVTNVMLSKSYAVKVHELESMSRKDSVLQISTAMKQNPFYQSDVCDMKGPTKDAHSGYDAYALAHLIFLIQNGKGSSEQKALLQSGKVSKDDQKRAYFLTCEP